MQRRELAPPGPAALVHVNRQRRLPIGAVPKAGKKNYGLKLATSDLKGWLKGVKVKKAFAKNKSWYVHSKYGKPYRRTWGGYVFYKIKGEPHCQLRSYTLE
ncbi:MAG TPA: hypothetical protein EYP98_17395, partial [Planctomycetes bacterium]|nr:hypothetical protein [Planctomycetota bacterium]